MYQGQGAHWEGCADCFHYKFYNYIGLTYGINRINENLADELHNEDEKDEFAEIVKIKLTNLWKNSKMKLTNLKRIG